MRNKFSTPKRHVSEAVWLPSYAVIAIYILGYVRNAAVATFAMFVALGLFRVFLEVIYRLVFGDERLTLRIGVVAVVAQLVVWGGLFALWQQ